MVASLALAAVFAAIVGICTYCVVQLQREEIQASKDDFEKYKIDAGKAVSDANARAAEASQKAAEAQLALEKFKAPRMLTLEQQAKITEEMEPFAGTPIVFGVFQDPEAFALLDQVSRMLTLAGWIEQEWKSGGDIVLTRGGGHPIAGFTVVTGVYVQADASHAADFGPIVAKLAQMLSEAGIGAKAEVGRMGANTNNDAIKILIGQKPR